MANILGMTRDGISYNIRILREKGILERIGSTKNGEWKIYDKIQGRYLVIFFFVYL